MHHNKRSRENAREHQERHLREVGALKIGPPSKTPNSSPTPSPIKEKYYQPIPSETQNHMPKAQQKRSSSIQSHQRPQFQGHCQPQAQLPTCKDDHTTKPGSATGEPGKTETANNKAELKYKRKPEVNYENEKKNMELCTIKKQSSIQQNNTWSSR